MEGFFDKAMPSIHVRNEPIWNELVMLKKRIKIRYVTEVTVDNISYCKKLLVVCYLPHFND